ncbi:hypothetical protein IW136_004260, partial [Coemansia sp. RSA 678]
MRTITSAIRPRRRRATNESTGSLVKQPSMSVLQRTTSKLLPADEPPVYLGRSYTEDSAADMVRNVGSSDSLAGREPADRDADNGRTTHVPFSGSADNGDDDSSTRRRNNNMWPSALLSHPLYCESIEENSGQEAPSGTAKPESEAQAVS